MEDEEYEKMYHMEQSYWWFLGKHFLVEDNFRRLVSRGHGQDKILDVGCGTGSILKLLDKFGNAYGVEYSSQAIYFLRKRGIKLLVQSDANCDMPFKADTFSAVTCLDVLEHLDDDLALLNEMVRICKPGGYIFITVPAFKILWSIHDEALHHKRRYTWSRLRENIKGIQCKVIKASYYNSILFVPILVTRRLRRCFSKEKPLQSDFFITIPNWLNRILTFLLTIEVYYLRSADFPWGVSFLLILQKTKKTSLEIEKDD